MSAQNQKSWSENGIIATESSKKVKLQIWCQTAQRSLFKELWAIIKKSDLLEYFRPQKNQKKWTNKFGVSPWKSTVLFWGSYDFFFNGVKKWGKKLDFLRYFWVHKDQKVHQKMAYISHRKLKKRQSTKCVKTAQRPLFKELRAILEKLDTLAYFWLQKNQQKLTKKCGVSYWKSKKGHQVQENRVPCLFDLWRLFW